MCGIFGFSKFTDACAKMAPFLAFDMSKRGRDSWGATNGWNTHKELGSITKTFHVPDWVADGPVIFHTRGASVGEVNIPNAHPFQFPMKADEGEEIGHVVGVHNGAITNHIELATKYSRNFAVDSMHPFAHLAEGRKMTDINGWGALAWFQVTYEDAKAKLYLCRFNMPELHVFQTDDKDGVVIFASTAMACLLAAEMAGVALIEYKCDPEILYFVEDKDGKDVFMRGPVMTFGGRTWAKSYETSNKLSDSRDTSYGDFPVLCTKCGRRYAICTCTYSSRSYTSTSFDPTMLGEVSRKNNKCACCFRVEVNRQKNVVCEECLKKREGWRDESAQNKVYISDFSRSAYGQA